MYDIILFTAAVGSKMYIRPYGAYKCAHELRRAGYRVLVVNQFHQFNIDEIKQVLDRAVDTNTLFVGVSNTFLIAEDNLSNRQSTNLICPQGSEFQQEFVEYIKQINSKCKIVVGGANTTYNFNNPLVDYAVIGYGDLSIVNLANHLKHNEPLRKSRRSVYGTTIIDDPVAEGFDFKHSTMSWVADDVVLPNEVLPLEIARGCVFSCKFCNYILNGKKNHDYIKQYDIIRSELEYNYKTYGITTYTILDDTFNDSEVKLDRMLEVVKSLSFKPRFWCYTRLDLLSKHPHTIQKMIDIGVCAMYFGIETFNKKTGTIIGKGYSPAEQIKTINYIKDTYKSDISLFGSFIIGLPEEKPTSIVKSFNSIASGEIKLDSWAFKPLTIFKKNNFNWDSAFGVDLTKYGYEELPGNDATVSTVHWKNKYFTSETARELGEKFQAQNARRKIGGQYIFEYMNLGFKFEELNDKTIDNVVRQTINDRYEQFIKQYKDKLTRHLNDTSKI